MVGDLEKTVQKNVVFNFITLKRLDVTFEYLQCQVTGMILTNPGETIVNCLAHIEVLASIAKKLRIEPTDKNLETLFDVIFDLYQKEGKIY